MRGNKNLLTKALLSSALGASSTLFAAAQISFGGEPASFRQPENSLRSAQTTKVVVVRPDFNPDDIKSTHVWDAQQVHVKPLVIGRSIATDINFARDAERITLEDGTVVYRLAINVKDAKANVLYYDDFFIPKNGGELYIYTPDRKNVLGKYTHETHPTHGSFASEALPGTTAILEYRPALNSQEMPSLLISAVGHIFTKAAATKDPGEDDGSDDCSVNINCSDGADWQEQKAGVVQMMMRHGNSVSLCTGNLLNNTNEDFTPYIISAAHCESLDASKKATADDLNQWLFTFHYEKSGCSSGSFALGHGKTMVGCDLMAFLPIKGQSDGLLLKLDQMIPDSYRVYYSGWDRTGAIPASGVGIHHPAGDAKKLSVFNGNVTSSTWSAEGVTGGTDAHYYFHFTKGETEGGSSGSSLWNENKLVVGTLTGGGGRCQSGTNFYGKLQYHWDKYKKDGDASTQMATFLDPKTNGQATKVRGRWKDEAGTLRPLLSVTGIKISREGNKLKVTWAPIPRTHLAEGWKVKYNIRRNGKDLNKRTEATEFTESIAEAEKDNYGSITYGIQARYEYGTDIPTEVAGKPERYAVTDWVEQGIYVGEKSKNVPVTSAKKEDDGVHLSWNMPYNFQEVTLFGAPKETSEYGNINMHYKREVYTNHHPKGFTPSEMALVGKFPTASFNANGASLYVHGIRVVPTQKLSGTYKAYVHSSKMMNSAYYVSQPFDVPSDWKPGQWVTIMLKKPIAIDLERVLYAGVTIPNRNKNPFPSVAYVKYTSDAVREYVDGQIVFEDGKDIYTYTDATTYGQIMDNYSGYAAISILVSSNRTPATSNDDQRIYVTGKNVVAFPKVKGFVVKRNGSIITSVDSVREYTDKDGSENDKYTVEVEYEEGVYTGNEEIVPEATAPSVYPTTIGVDGLLHVTSSEALSSLSIYTMDGQLVKVIHQPSSSVSVEDLLSGNYVVVLDGAHGRSTYRIIR